MDEIHRLRAQISRIVHASFPTVNSDFSPRLAPPSEAQVRYFCSEPMYSPRLIHGHQLKVLRQLLTAGFIDQVAIRKDLVDKSSGTKYASARGVPYQALDIAEDVFIHPSSVLFHKPPPDFLVFEKVVRTSKPWIKGQSLKYLRSHRVD
jgi:ATP-dependent RNA helicase DHX37/DHR1